jgi:hypothetical protein
VNVYEVPAVRPATVHFVAGASALHVRPPGAAVTVYPTIGVLPEEAGAVQLTVADSVPAAAVTFVGAPGVLPGLTADVGKLGALAPAWLYATTVKVYAVPLVRLATEQEVAGANAEHV